MHKHIAIIIMASLLTCGIDAYAQKVDALTQMPKSQQTTQPQQAQKAPRAPQSAQAQRVPRTQQAAPMPNSPMPNAAMPNAPMQQQSQRQAAGEGKQMSPAEQYLKETATAKYKTTRKDSRIRHKATRKAVHSLKKKNYSEAVSGFRQALKADSSYAKAQYNVAIAHSGLQQYDTALSYYQRVCENPNATKEQRSNSHYNAGNIHLRKALAVRDTGGYDAMSLKNAIAEYKSSLRLNPTNADAQHNLSLAKKLLRPESQDGQGGGGQNQQNQEQNQDQQNQGQQNQNQDKNQQNQNQDQQNKDQQNQNQQNQQGQQGKQDRQKQEQSRREAEQMLNAMKNNEQQTMRAVRMKEAEKERRQGQPARIEKDW